MKKSSNYKILLIFVGMAVFILVLYLSLNKNINISLSALKDILYQPFCDINNKVDLIGSNINNEILDQNKELKELNKIENTLSEFRGINATIIERNHSYWLESMTINKGKKDGVDIGMAVAVSEGLIGKIVKITNTTSVVQLITSDNNDNKISVKIKVGDTYIYKVLELENNELVINGIDNNIEINDNEVVLTSGLSDIYPSGIVIGKITNIKNDKYGVSKKAYVESSVNFENLRFVTVLERLI